MSDPTKITALVSLGDTLSQVEAIAVRQLSRQQRSALKQQDVLRSFIRSLFQDVYQRTAARLGGSRGAAQELLLAVQDAVAARGPKEIVAAKG